MTFRKSLMAAFLCGWAVLGVLATATAAPRKVTTPIRVDYSVSDPQFLRSIEGLLGAPLLEGNHVEELINGIRVFPAMLEAIQGAKKSITLENFIWSSGKLSDQFVKALSERAQAGVKVHVLTDCIGSARFNRKDRKALMAAGVELIRYNEPSWWVNPVRLNHRTHRKILVVDGHVGFIGGICISDKWTGDAEGPPLWRDTHFRVRGPVVAQMQGIFCDNWLEQSGKVLEGEAYYPELSVAGKSKIQAFKSGPTDGVENARLVHLYSIAAARKTIRLSHSYFIPDQMMEQALLDAKARGVHIEIVAPGKIGVNIVQRASRPQWRKLIEAGVDFYVYQKAYYHCKVMIIDDVWVSSGSINLDRRSFRINDEANINVLDPEFAARQIEAFEKDKKDSKRLSAEGYLQRKWYVKWLECFATLFRMQL